MTTTWSTPTDGTATGTPITLNTREPVTLTPLWSDTDGLSVDLNGTELTRADLAAIHAAVRRITPPYVRPITLPASTTAASERQLRRTANKHGLCLIKVREGSRGYAECGPYMLTDDHNRIVAKGLDLDQVAEYLDTDA